MRKLFIRNIRPFIGGFLLALILLFVQAYSDLNLPYYMSNIVNVGIQQQGIEEEVPLAIAKNDFEMLLSVSTEANKEILEKNYSIKDPSDPTLDPLRQGDYKEDVLSAESLYVYIGNEDAETLEQVSQAFGIGFTTANYMAEDNKSLPEAQEMAASTDPAFISQSVPIIIGEIYKNLGVDLSYSQSSYILKTGLFMLGISLIGGIASIFATLFATRIGAGFARNLRSEVFAKIETFTNEEFDKFSTASLITRSTNDILQIQQLIIIGIRMLCYAPIMAVGGVIMAINTSTSMVWVIGLAIASMAVTIIFVMSIAIPRFKIMQKLIDRLNLVAREGLNGLLVVKAFGNEDFEKKRVDLANKDLSKVGLFVNRLMSYLFPIIMLIMNGTTVLVVWVGADYVSQSTLQVGDMIAFMQYSMQVIMSFLMLAMVFMFIPRASVSAERIMEVLETDPTIKDPLDPLQISKENIATVEFKNVSFKYHGADNYALENISFKAMPGKVTAFIGSTGSGKSTIVNLIPRFYDCDKGEVLVDGVNVKDLTQKELRSHIGLVPQKNVLLSGTINSNLQYGNDLTPEELDEIARVSQSYDFISEKELGYDENISQGGTNVSGGQRQRLAIGRALAKDSDIYIFDDSFSALDFKTDAKLRSDLKKYLNDETVIIVAQRINTIMDADEIFVIDEGKIVGQGTHKELIKNCQEYLEIALSQLSEEEVRHSEQ